MRVKLWKAGDEPVRRKKATTEADLRDPVAYKQYQRKAYADTPEHELAKAAKLANTTEKFGEIVERLAKRDGLSFGAAMRRLSREQPELAEAARAQSYVSF